jgi:hypothetical protein
VSIDDSQSGTGRKLQNCLTPLLLCYVAQRHFRQVIALPTIHYCHYANGCPLPAVDQTLDELAGAYFCTRSSNSSFAEGSGKKTLA